MQARSSFALLHQTPTLASKCTASRFAQEVEHELFHIFTYHSLHADPNTPLHLKATQLRNFAVECKMFNKRFTKMHLDVIFAKVLRDGSRQKSLAYSDRLAYSDFLNVLLVVAVQL